jgi:hypothetical protein
MEKIRIRDKHPGSATLIQCAVIVFNNWMPGQPTVHPLLFTIWNLSQVSTPNLLLKEEVGTDFEEDEYGGEELSDDND